MTVFLYFFGTLTRPAAHLWEERGWGAAALAPQSVRVPSCTITSSIKHVLLYFDIFDIVFDIEGHTGL